MTDQSNNPAQASSSITTDDGHFIWKKRPKGFGLRRNLKVSRAVAPKPITEQAESKSLCVIYKPTRSAPVLEKEYEAKRSFKASDLYIYESIGQISTWKSTLYKKRFSLVFDLAIDTLPESETAMMLCILDLTANQYQDLGSFYMFVGFELRHPDLKYPIHLPYRPIDNVKANHLLDEVRILKTSLHGLPSISHNEFILDICFVKQLLGSGISEPISKSKGRKPDEIIIPNNVSKYCLGTAIVQGMALVKHMNDQDNFEKEKEWHRISILNDQSTEYEDELAIAKQLLIDSGVNKSHDYTIKDVTAVQDFLSGQYQIVVFSEGHNKSPVYTGPSLMEKNIIPLVCKKGHYELIKKLNSFVGAGFYCVHCNVKSSALYDHYSCPLRCRLCAAMDCVAEDGVEIKCEDCLQTFYSEACMKTHKTKGILGKRSRCEMTISCPNCQKLVKDLKKHKCHSYYCQHCKIVREKGHQCTLPPKDFGATWGNPQKRIFFTVKMAKTKNREGAIVEKPILILAIRFCPECRAYLPTSVIKGAQMKCGSCSPDGARTWLFDCMLKRNRNKDPIAEFLQWLINKNHIRFAAVSHDLSESANDLLLEYLTREDVPKLKECVLENGRLKYIIIEGSRMKIIDSTCFIPASVKEFASALSLPDIGLGRFPIKFLSFSNIDYVGPLPPLHMYLDSSSTKEEQEKIKEFYRAEEMNNAVFNFQDAVIKQTYLELVQMSLCFLTLETVMFSQLGVRLFDETPNIYRAAICGFRRKFHTDKALPLDRGQGSNFRQTFSMTGMKYLAWRAEHEGIPIDTAVNVGEYRVPGTPFHLDGFIQPCERYPRGLGIDVKGCYWHAHGCTYVPQMVARRELKVDTIRANDKKREEEIRRHIDLEIVWECQIALNRMTNPSMDEYMSNCNFEGKADMMNALFPLYSEVYQFHYRKESEKEKIFLRDLTDLPAICMRLGRYPKGEMRRLHGQLFATPMSKPDDLHQAEGLLYCTVLPPKDLYTPLLQYKFDDNVSLSLCRICAEQKNTTGCEHRDDQRAFTGTWTTFELKLALKYGYIITRVIGAIHWSEWKQFSVNDNGEIESGIFSGLVDVVLGNKIACSGYPKHMESDIERDKYISQIQERYLINIAEEVINKNVVARRIDDALLKIWKTFSERNDTPITEHTNTPSNLWKILEDPTMQIKEIKAINDEFAFFAHGKKKKSALPLYETVSLVEVLTASHIRCRLFEYIQKLSNIKQDLLYLDEKYIIYRNDDGNDPLLDLTPEYPDNNPELDIIEFMSPSTNCFLISHTTPHGTAYRIQAPGFEKLEALKDLQIQSIIQQVELLLEGEYDAVDLEYNHIERDSHYLLQNKLKTKRLDNHLSSRFQVSGEDGTVNTVPIGTVF